MAIRLTLICHAATPATRKAAFPDDEALEPKAAAQAAALAHTLGHIDRAWTSPALRSRQTADALRLDATVDPALRDADFGCWTGLPFNEVATREPEAVASWMAEPGAAPHGGESTLDLIGRVATWLDHHGRVSGHTLAVTHAAVIRAALVHALGAEASCFWRIEIGPLAVVDLRRGSPRWMLRSIRQRD